MKKLILLAMLALVAPTFSHAQTAAQVVAKTLEARNAAVCDARGLQPTCTDAEALAAWCVANNKPAGAMCVASDVRSDSEKVFTAAQLFSEQQAALDKITAEKTKRERKALLVAIELAILDDAVRTKVCAIPEIAAACK